MSLRIILALGAAILLLACSCDRNPLDNFPYNPQIVFTGQINGKFVELPGYLAYPNRCFFKDDSLIMEFYSKDYSPTSTPVGTFLKTWFFSQPTDTGAFPRSEKITTRNSKLTCFVISDVSSCSYNINPSDTVGGSNFMGATVVYWPWGRGQAVEFSSITAQASSVGHSGCGSVLTLSGKIRGNLE